MRVQLKPETGSDSRPGNQHFPDVQTAALEVDLIPAQADKLGSSQTVSEGNEDHC